MEDEIKILTDDELEKAFVDDALKSYLREIRRYPTLSIDQQMELGLRKDKEARDILVKCNLRLVVSIALHYKSRLKHLELLDIIQEGTLGLISATETYDPSRGAFTTYAYLVIKSKIRRGIIQKDSEIRKPEHLVDDTNKYLKLVNNYEQKNLPLPNDEDICDILDITMKRLKIIRTNLSQTMVSLNQPIGEDEKDELGDIVSGEKNNDDDNVINKIDTENFLLIIKEILSPVRYFVIYHNILSNDKKTLEYLANILNIARQRVAQIQEAALKKIKPYMEKNSELFNKKLSEIRDREGNKFYSLKTAPLSPTKIIKFMYIKDDLTDIERKLYELNVFGKYKYSNKDIANILEISLEELKQIMISLKSKMNQKFSDAESYKRFQILMAKTYGSKIFNVDINKKEKIINYYALEEKYSSLSLEEILSYFGDINYNLTSDEEKLLSRFFGVCDDYYLVSARDIEQEINIVKFGFKKPDYSKYINDLYKKYQIIKNDFSEEQQLYLECYVFGKRNKQDFNVHYSTHTTNRCKIMSLLERKYYHIFEYFEKSFTKEKWLEVREKYSHRFTKQKIKVLDLYFGLFGRPYSRAEIVEMLNIDTIDNIIQPAIELVNRLYIGIVSTLEIDKELYIPYVLQPYFEFIPETRKILKMYLIDGKTYEEISELTQLDKRRISSIITGGIRKIDYYRFNIIEPFILQKDELYQIFEVYINELSFQDRQIIELKYLQYLENSDIAKKLGLDLKIIKNTISRFNVFYDRFKTKDVSIDMDDIKNELSLHQTETVLTDREIELASFYYGIPSRYNPNACKLSKKELMVRMNISNNIFWNIENSIKLSLKKKKIGLKKSELIYIPRDELKVLLSDVHLPISERERDIICHLLELNGYKYMTLDELSLKVGESNSYVKLIYQKAIANIYKYINHEIEGIVNYEQDILPFLKYFGTSDRKKIIDYYKNGLTYEEIAKKCNISISQLFRDMNRIRNSLYEIQNNPDAKKFDFDYYLEVIDNPNLPFYGNLKLATKVFDLTFGMSGEERLAFTEIVERLNLNLVATTIRRLVYDLMLSVCKFRDGIEKEMTFSFEEVQTYYETHQDSIPDYQKIVYQKYFKRVNKSKEKTDYFIKIPYCIMADLIKDNEPDAFVLENATNDEILVILKKYGKKINRRVRIELMCRYGIKEREFMNGKEINHVYKLLATLDAKKLEQTGEQLVLGPKKIN